MVRIIPENLIDNAIKFHNDRRGWSRFDIRNDRKQSGGGPRGGQRGGIAEANRNTIFQMFVRASERSETGGIGLYLAKIATEKLVAISDFPSRRRTTEFIVHFPVNLRRNRAAHGRADQTRRRPHPVRDTWGHLPGEASQS